jgi:hypothetical protein
MIFKNKNLFKILFLIIFVGLFRIVYRPAHLYIVINYIKY